MGNRIKEGLRRRFLNANPNATEVECAAEYPDLLRNDRCEQMDGQDELVKRQVQRMWSLLYPMK